MKQELVGTALLEPPAEAAVRASSTWPRLGVPLLFIAGFVAISLLPAVQQIAAARWSFWAAAGCLLAWWTALAFRTAATDRRLTLSLDLRPQHYLQACMQGSVLLYWGYYWREVYHSAHLIAAQLLFAYAFDMLLAWSRREHYTLGFAPFPVIFSINLFLWFKPPWFYLQCVLVAVGFAAKELIRWEKGGRHVHIFNPSSFPLGLFALVLLATGTTSMTWGQEIATTLNNAPYIYLWIFVIGLPGQYLFGVTTMTMSAVVTMYLFGLLYFAATGTYYFVDSYIPIAVFLGMHLLFTDPSTSPRSDLGRILFGILYALSVITLYAVLGRLGLPTFYDKLMAVPILNLTIKIIDAAAQGPLRRLDPSALARSLVGRRRHLAYIAIWSVVFVTISAAEGVGDVHRGQHITFWMQACRDGRPTACRQAALLASFYCTAGSGWACNEYGVLLQPARRPDVAGRSFQRACDLGFSAGCDNRDPARAERPIQAPPHLEDYRIVARGRKGPMPDLTPLALYRRACAHGFSDACERACAAGDSAACRSSGP